MAPAKKPAIVVFFDHCLSPAYTEKIVEVAQDVAKAKKGRAIGRNVRLIPEGATKGLPEAAAAVIPEGRKDLAAFYKKKKATIVLVDEEARTEAEAKAEKEAAEKEAAEKEAAEKEAAEKEAAEKEAAEKEGEQDADTTDTEAPEPDKE